jgi:hypothetical protein
MTAIVILNVMFAVLVVVGIVSLLSWAIVSDRAASVSLRRRARRRSRSSVTAPVRTGRSSAANVGA